MTALRLGQMLSSVWSMLAGRHPLARLGAAALMLPLCLSLWMAYSIGGAEGFGGFVAGIYVVCISIPTTVALLLVAFGSRWPRLFGSALSGVFALATVVLAGAPEERLLLFFATFAVSYAAAALLALIDVFVTEGESGPADDERRV